MGAVGSLGPAPFLSCLSHPVYPLMKSALSLAFVLALLLVGPAASAQDYSADATASQDLLATLDERGDFTILVGALRDTGLDAALATGETFTLFAPTDAAFQALPAGTLENLSPDELTEILRYHLLAGAVSSQDAVALASAPSVQGDALSFATTDGQLTVNDAAITEADIQASNGVIHVVDTVLMPAADAETEEAGMMEKEMSEEAPMEDDSEMEDDAQMEEGAEMEPMEDDGQ